MTKPCIIGINGPNESGKTHIVESVLPRLVPDAHVMRVTDQIYGVMRDRGLPNTELPYQKYKQLPYAREKIVAVSNQEREKDPAVFINRLLSSEEYQSKRVVIIDNLGLDIEVDRVADESKRFLLLRIETPYDRGAFFKAQFHEPGKMWVNDCRFPLVAPYMLTAHDSIQLTLLLEWLTNLGTTSAEAGPYNDIREYWFRYFADSRGTIFYTDAESVSGDAGGLG